MMKSLAGEWQVRPDPPGGGVRQNWYAETFAGDAATLPGTVDTNPRQPPARKGDLSGFTPVYPYTGGPRKGRAFPQPERNGLSETRRTRRRDAVGHSESG